jgi:hypothetical protein
MRQPSRPPPLPWPVARTGQMVASRPNDLCLHTLGQFQCICIAVAIYPTPATTNWTQAWLAHASHPNHAVIQNIINTHSQQQTITRRTLLLRVSKGGLAGSDQRPVCGRGRCKWRERCAGTGLNLFNHRPRQHFRSVFEGMESLGRSFNEGYGLDNILVAKSLLYQGYGLGAHLRSAMGARLSVRSDLHMNLECFHRTSISLNGFPPPIT